MIDFDEAIEIAKSHYSEKGNFKLTKIYEAEHIWIVYAIANDQIKYGNVGISIDKKSGELKSFILPSKANFEILKSAVLTELQ